MKINPYRAAEYTLTGLICTVFAVMIIWAITAAGGWHVVGYIAAFIVGLVLIFMFTSWWGEKRKKWDETHGVKEQYGEPP